jgi:hypothetical protein
MLAISSQPASRGIRSPAALPLQSALVLSVLRKDRSKLDIIDRADERHDFE